MDISKTDICRTCMSKNENLLSIFDIQISDTDTVQMAEFLNNLTSIEINKDDGLPHQLCICCIDTICKVFNFIQICKESDSSLRIYSNSATENLKNEAVDESNHSSDLNTDEPGNENAFCEVKLEVQDIVSDRVTTNLTFSNGDNNKTETQEVSIYQCEKCEIVCPTKFELASHALAHDSSRTYKCRECPKTFSKKTYLKAHMRLHNNVQDKQHICKTCGQTFRYSYLLNLHRLKHSDEKPFPCSKCKKGCLTAESLRRHMKTHEVGHKKKIYACHICAKEYQYPSFLSEHMKNHTGEKPFLCSTCGKGFRQRGALEYHFRSHTGYKPHKCEICQNNFTCGAVLRAHMRRHTDERPYICDICGVGFRQSSDMKRHRSIHSGDKQALCTICGKQMSTTGQLTVHLRSHTGEKPFGCEVCQKAFTTKTMLVKHQRIHTGERPYTCKICGRSFTQSSTLKTHGMVHAKNNSANPKSESNTTVPRSGNKNQSETLLTFSNYVPSSLHSRSLRHILQSILNKS